MLLTAGVVDGVSSRVDLDRPGETIPDVQ